MATILDIGLFESFNTIFPVLLVFALVFAILQKTNMLGKDKNTLNAFIAILVAFLVLLSKTVINVVNYMTPWFVIVLIFTILLLLLYQTLGVTDKSIGDFVTNDSTVKWAIFGIGTVILLAALGNELGQNIGPYLSGEVPANLTEGGVATSDFSQNITATLFHPKILGLIFLFTIAIFAVAFLSGDTAPSK